MHCANSSINFSVTDTNSSRTSEAALWPSTYISPLSNSTPCIRKDRISSKSLMRLSICLWKPSIGDSQDAFSRSGWLWPVDAKGEPLKATSYMAVGFYVAKYVNKKSDMDLAAKGLGAKEWNN